MARLGTHGDYIELLLAMNEAHYERERAAEALLSPDETELLRQSRAAARVIAARAPRVRPIASKPRRMTAH
jgi:hypothetical protein